MKIVFNLLIVLFCIVSQAQNKSGLLTSEFILKQDTSSSELFDRVLNEENQTNPDHDTSGINVHTAALLDSYKSLLSEFNDKKAGIELLFVKSHKLMEKKYLLDNESVSKLHDNASDLDLELVNELRGLFKSSSVDKVVYSDNFNSVESDCSIKSAGKNLKTINCFLLLNNAYKIELYSEVTMESFDANNRSIFGSFNPIPPLSGGSEEQEPKFEVSFRFSTNMTLTVIHPVVKQEILLITNSTYESGQFENNKTDLNNVGTFRVSVDLSVLPNSIEKLPNPDYAYSIFSFDLPNDLKYKYYPSVFQDDSDSTMVIAQDSFVTVNELLVTDGPDDIVVETEVINANFIDLILKSYDTFKKYTIDELIDGEQVEIN